MQVAQEILNQLGGHRFIAMTGSKNFVAGENSLTMKLTRNKLSAQYLTIELTSMDNYVMTFKSIKSKTLDIVEKAKFENVYCDQLQKFFTDATGLDTNL